MSGKILLKTDEIKQAMRDISKTSGMTMTFFPDGSISYTKDHMIPSHKLKLVLSRFDMVHACFCGQECSCWEDARRRLGI